MPFCKTDIFFPVLYTVIYLIYSFTRASSEEYCTTDSCQDVIYDKHTHFISLADDQYFAKISLPSILKTVDFEQSISDSITTITWPRYGSVEITKNMIGDVGCHVVQWKVISRDFEPHDCILLADAHWYGGAELHYQRWPLENTSLNLQEFASEDVVVMKESIGNVLEPFWISSNGVAIFVDNAVPLHFTFNSSGSQKMCFIAKFSDVYRKIDDNELPILKYTVCKGHNIRTVFQTLRTHIMDVPIGMPDVRMIKSPIWSTWAKYKVNIDQHKVLNYAEEINQYGFSNSQIEIDDMFSTKYGDFDFDPKKFPDPTEMIKQLRHKGFRTTVWITPFANLDSEAFGEGTSKGYWLTDKSKTVPALVKWWQGIGAVIDTTNQNATSWYNARLDQMKAKYGIDSFKFDAGEITFLPIPLNTHQPISNPNIYTTKYVETVSHHGNMIEVRCGYKSQKHPIFVRMADKESRWGYDNGLRTIIPTTLTFGILGYPFILPDMIGGNGYGEVLQKDVVLPNRELYIRWLQMSAFLPAMQFSFAPWDYDEEVIKIALDMVKVHETIVTPIIISAAEDAIKYGKSMKIYQSPFIDTSRC